MPLRDRIECANGFESEWHPGNLPRLPFALPARHPQRCQPSSVHPCPSLPPWLCHQDRDSFGYGPTPPCAARLAASYLRVASRSPRVCDDPPLLRSSSDALSQAALARRGLLPLSWPATPASSFSRAPDPTQRVPVVRAWGLRPWVQGPVGAVVAQRAAARREDWTRVRPAPAGARQGANPQKPTAPQPTRDAPQWRE